MADALTRIDVRCSAPFNYRQSMKPFSVSVFLSSLNKGICGLSIALLAGCASTIPDERINEQTQYATRAYQEAVNMTGRLSIRYQADGSEQSMHGSFNWMQRPDRTLVSLLSPLGNTLATIESSASETILRQPGQAPRVASDVDALTAQALGWPLPVAGLRYWLQGFASDGNGLHAIASPAQNGLPDTSMQNGWRLHYANWNREAVPPHPKRLDLQRDTSQAGNVEIRLIIDSFQPL